MVMHVQAKYGFTDEPLQVLNDHFYAIVVYILLDSAIDAFDN